MKNADLVVVVILAALIALIHGCGASPAVRRSYADEIAACQANEIAIVHRSGTTEDEDREALRTERERCNAALQAIGGAP